MSSDFFCYLGKIAGFGLAFPQETDFARQKSSARMPKHGESPSFIADSMLGRLARWLRALGFDVAYDPFAEDRALLRRAREAGRVLLTRDSRLVQVRDCPPYIFVESDRLEDQLAQVKEAAGLNFAEVCFLTRCMECNGLLSEVDKASIRCEVPPYVFSTQTDFRRCPRCRRVYWGGTHVPRLQERLRRLAGLAGSATP